MKFVHPAPGGESLERCVELVWRDPKTSEQIRIPEIDRYKSFN